MDGRGDGTKEDENENARTNVKLFWLVAAFDYFVFAGVGWLSLPIAANAQGYGPAPVGIVAFVETVSGTGLRMGDIYSQEGGSVVSTPQAEDPWRFYSDDKVLTFEITMYPYWGGSSVDIYLVDINGAETLIESGYPIDSEYILLGYGVAFWRAYNLLDQTGVYGIRVVSKAYAYTSCSATFKFNYVAAT